MICIYEFLYEFSSLCVKITRRAEFCRGGAMPAGRKRSRNGTEAAAARGVPQWEERERGLCAFVDGADVTCI